MKRFGASLLYTRLVCGIAIVVQIAGAPLSLAGVSSLNRRVIGAFVLLHLNSTFFSALRWLAFGRARIAAAASAMPIASIMSSVVSIALR